MSKVALYLQGHLAGGLTLRKDIRTRHSYDSSVLSVTPDIVAYPRNTNDIRKVLRFSWQLAEKGHGLPITPRGIGTDTTGAAIGRGINLDLSRHMNAVYEYDSKQKLLRLQPGATVQAVESALRLQGANVPALADGRGTVGGELALNRSHRLTAKYGRIGEWVDKMEVVLDDGEVIQTGRINKKELKRRTGWQGREGDIYRGISGVLEDHASLIASIRSGEYIPQGGYPGIADVVAKDGSVDLAPLFVGSQGTLGVISEVILKTLFVSKSVTNAAIAMKDPEAARDILDKLIALAPAFVEYYDGRLLTQSIADGNSYAWLGGLKTVGAVLVFGFDEFNEKLRQRQMKKALKLFQKFDGEAAILTPDKHDDASLQALRSVAEPHTPLPLHDDRGRVPLVEGFFVPQARFEEFVKGLAALEKNLHVELPIAGSPITGHFTILPTLSLHKVGDKQKVFKIIDELGALLSSIGGDLVSGNGEGRLLSRFARLSWSEEYTQMVGEIKRIFDPHGILNPGVKSDVQLKSLVAELRSDNSIGII